MLTSCLCSQAQMESAVFQSWSEKLRPAWDPSGSGIKQLHRKIWEWCYIAQALQERDLLRPGRRGLGFGVGKEPLSALFASFGCEIVATDMMPDQAQRAGWSDTNQHADTLAGLNEAKLCAPEVFRRLVSLRHVDMNAIAPDLRDFDFTWSACSFEHLGSIAHGQRFIARMMDCLRPGGVGVHTTEFNLASNERTLDHDQTVLFRRKDIEAIARQAKEEGHFIDLDLTLGNGLADNFIDVPPYKHNPHLRLKIGEYVTTSVGLILTRSTAARKPGSWHRRLLSWLARSPGKRAG